MLETIGLVLFRSAVITGLGLTLLCLVIWTDE